MNNINDVVDYIITKVKVDQEDVLLSHLKLQKLLYYIQAWSLGINHERFFEEDFEAWVHGPVCREVFDRFRDTKTLYSDIGLEDRLNTHPSLDTESEEFVEFVLGNYLEFSGSQLERMSHAETPWIEARRGLDRFESSNRVISIDLMRSYYGKEWEEINQ